MREATKDELEDEIWEMTKGAVAQVYLDPWTGQVVRREEGLKLACNQWGGVNYSRDELRQIRDWLKRHLLLLLRPTRIEESSAEQAEART